MMKCNWGFSREKLEHACRWAFARIKFITKRIAMQIASGKMLQPKMPRASHLAVLEGLRG
jgi:hypothetical protein